MNEKYNSKTKMGTTVFLSNRYMNFKRTVIDRNLKVKFLDEACS